MPMIRLKKVLKTLDYVKKHLNQEEIRELKTMLQKDGKMWRCINCNKELKTLGMTRHRAMHRDRKEYCQMMDSDGNIHHYHYEEG